MNNGIQGALYCDHCDRPQLHGSGDRCFGNLEELMALEARRAFANEIKHLMALYFCQKRLNDPSLIIGPDLELALGLLDAYVSGYIIPGFLGEPILRDRYEMAEIIVDLVESNSASGLGDDTE